MSAMKYEPDKENLLKRESIDIFVLERETLKVGEKVRFEEKLDVGVKDHHDYVYLVCPDKAYGKTLEITYNNISNADEKFITSKQFKDELLKETQQSSFKSLFVEYMEQYVTFDKVLNEPEKLSVLMEDFIETEEMMMNRLAVNKERTFSDLRFLPESKLEHIVPEKEKVNRTPQKEKNNGRGNGVSHMKPNTKKKALDTNTMMNER